MTLFSFLKDERESLGILQNFHAKIKTQFNVSLKAIQTSNENSMSFLKLFSISKEFVSQPLVNIVYPLIKYWQGTSNCHLLESRSIDTFMNGAKSY